MAIEDTFKNIQAVRGRQFEKIRNQQRKQQRVDTLFAAGNILSRIGNTFLKEQARNFLYNEDNMAKQAQYKTFLNSAENTIKEYQAAEAFEGGIRSYLTDKRANFLMRDAQSEFAELGELNETELQEYIQGEASAWAEQNEEDFKAAYDEAVQLGTFEEYQAALASEYQGPRNVGEFLYRGAKGFFTGKDKSQIRAGAANGVATRMEQAGQSVQAYRAAVNAGYDINSAEVIQSLIDDRTLSRKEDKEIGFDLVNADIKRHSGVLSITYRDKTFERADGTTYTKRTIERGDNPNNRFVISEQNVSEGGELEDDYFKPDPPVLTTTTNEFGTEITTTVIQFKDPFGNIDPNRTITTREFRADEDPIQAALAVSDVEVQELLNQNSQLSSHPTFAGEDTAEKYGDLLARYYSQSITDPSPGDITKIRERAAKEILGELRVLISSESAQTPLFGSSDFIRTTDSLTPVAETQEDIMRTSSKELIPLFLQAKLMSIRSKQAVDGKGFAEDVRGFDLTPDNAHVTMVAALLSRENSNLAVTVSPETTDFLFNNISVEMLDGLSKDYKKLLLQNIIKDESAASWQESEIPKLIASGYSNEDIKNIVGLVIKLDQDTRDLTFTNTSQRSETTSSSYPSSYLIGLN